MKKTTLFFALAAIVGVGSAFGTKMKAGEYVQVLPNGLYELRATEYPDGECTSEDGICTYTKIHEGSDSNSLNFAPAEDGTFETGE